MKVSIVMSTLQRDDLLRMGLQSIRSQDIDFDYEIIVVNDGMEGSTMQVCEEFGARYIWTGQRHKKKIIRRTPCIPMNVGIWSARGEIVVLTCPEIYHIGNGLNNIISPLATDKKALTIPTRMYFDNTGEFTRTLDNDKDIELRTDHVYMPFLLGVYKYQLTSIGGYDVDFTEGYACEDNDLMDRLVMNGCQYQKVNADIVHLYHGPRCAGLLDWDNLPWVKNYAMYLERRGIIERNGKHYNPLTKCGI